MTDFHGAQAAVAAEAEWRRVHQERQAPSELRVVRVAAGAHKPHALVVLAGLAKSNGEAVRLLRQRAVRRDGVVLEAAEVALAAARASCCRSGRPATCASRPADEKAGPITGVPSTLGPCTLGTLRNLRNSNKRWG